MLQVEVKNKVWGWMVMDVMIELVKCEMRPGLVLSDGDEGRGNGGDRSMSVILIQLQV